MHTMTYEELWKALSSHIKGRVSPDGYRRWFSGMGIVSDDGSRLVFQVPNPIHKFFIESNYLDLLASTVAEVLDSERKIEVHCRETEEPEIAPPSEPKTKAAVRLDASKSIGMNPRSKFETFVVGSNNQFAYAAAVAVAQAPARTYNPLFVYGGTGLGKTHLLHAIGHHVLENKKSAKVVYLKSEDFTNEFIDAIQHGTLYKFRKKYRQADLLMIDDIQFLAGKERSQEEFFHTFNALHDGHKQIVLTSDRPACEIERLEQRLVSRFEWGMTAELQPPDVETRIAILKSKAACLQISLEPWIFEFIADKIRNNVRRLEGALMRVASYKSLSESPISREAIETLLKDIFQEQARKAVTIDQIQRKVAEHYDVRLADMTSKRRPANIAFPRQIAMYLARELTRSSLTEIGDAFGGKDHGTVIHAIKLVKRKMEDDEKTRHIVQLLDTQLQR